MADGFTISADGLGDAQRRMQERAKRIADLAPALKFVAAEIEKRTDDAFRDQRSPFGEIWPTLAPSTQQARARKLRGAKRRSKKTGRLTKGAKGKRTEAIAAYQFGGQNVFKPLVDTGRMRRSVRVRVIKNELEFSAVGHMAPHITGSQKVQGQPPKRNPTVFQLANGQWRPIPEVMSLLLRTVSRYISTGKVV